jgi:hypothetical protein
MNSSRAEVLRDLNTRLFNGSNAMPYSNLEYVVWLPLEDV